MGLLVGPGERKVIHKVAVIGKGGVGKTTLIATLQQKRTVSEKYSETVGIQVTDVEGPIAYDGSGNELGKTLFRVWEVGSRYGATFPYMQPDAMKDCAAAIVVFSFADKASFQQVPAMLSQCDSEGIPCLLIGTKADDQAAGVVTAAIRQDLTVQHIKSALTVSVYETHARVALEVSDTAELTQCAGCLRRLYAEGLQGEEGEFAAYQLLLAAVQGGAQAVTLELLSLARRSRELVAEGRGDLSSHPFVRHAAAVAEAARGANFYRFFSLYCDAPRMSAYLMDAMLPRMRATGLRTLIAAHGTAVDLEFVADVLGLEGARAAAEYLTANGAVVDRSRGVMDPKASRAPTAGPHLPS